MSIFVKALTALLIATIPALPSVEIGPSTEQVPSPHPVVHRLGLTPPPAPAEGITAPGATPEQQDRVGAAVALFENAGLELPAVEIVFNDDTGPCRGHAGLYFAADNAGDADVVQVCSRLRIVLVHELAHAWEHHRIDDHARHDFTEHFGLETWNDHDHDWEDRGIEMAANAIAYTLVQAEPTDNENIVRFGCSYERLTGHELPNPDYFDCQA